MFVTSETMPAILYIRFIQALAYLLLEAINAFYKMWEIIMWASRRILIIDRRIQHQFLAIFSKIFVQKIYRCEISLQNHVVYILN